MKGYLLEDIYAALGETKVDACISMVCKVRKLIIIQLICNLCIISGY